jgi:RecB family endonuclease NucS
MKYVKLLLTGPELSIVIHESRIGKIRINEQFAMKWLPTEKKWAVVVEVEDADIVELIENNPNVTNVGTDFTDVVMS